MIKLVHVLIVVTLAASAHVLTAQSGNDLFQQALSKERAEGRLEEAIQIYERIVKEFAADRALAAKALVQIGHAYERLGSGDALKAYDRVLREYADQRPMADEARTRLAVLGRSSSKPAAFGTRHVWSNLADSISKDGRYLSFTDWETGDIAIRERASGVNRRVTNKGGWAQSPAVGESPLISPDGSQIAYSWCDNRDCDLRLISRAGGRPRVLYQNDDVRFVQPADWSPDGRQILMIVSHGDGTNRIGIVAIADRSVRILKTLGWRGASKAAFSPDGRYIAYEFPPVIDTPERDLFVLAADGSEENVLVRHPANEYLLGWFPDGRHILFSSDRLGPNSAWAIAVERGKPQGEPRLIKPNIGKVSGLGFTRTGDYYYDLAMGVRDVFVASLDPKAGMIDAAPQPLAGLEGGRFSGVWSPDGSQIAYLTQTAEVKGDAARVVSVRTLATNQLRNVPLKLNYAQYLAWVPDGRALMLQGIDLRGRFGLFRLDLATESLEPLLLDVDRFGGIAADGRSLFYQGRSPTHLGPGVRQRDLVTGDEKLVFARPVSGIELSPDSRWLALRTGATSSEGGASPAPSIHVQALTDGESRMLLTLQPSDTTGLGRALAWSPDSKYVFFTRGHELWRAGVDGKVPQKLTTVSFDMGGGARLSMHPDGKRIAISGGVGQWETWVMENLASTVEATAARR